MHLQTDGSLVIAVPPRCPRSWRRRDADADADSDSDTDIGDADGDGWSTPDDCDDTDPQVNPDQIEICNDSVDNNCDGGSGTCRLSGTVLAQAADGVWEGPSAHAGTEVLVADLVSGGGDDVLIASTGILLGSGLELSILRGRARLGR